MDYQVEGKTYVLRYQQLREEYLRHCAMSDKEFMANLPSATHLACIICYLKETPSYVCLSDEGIVHQLIHLMHIPDCPVIRLRPIRSLFKRTLMLAP